ncbi:MULTISPECIES: hypothetical protein [Rhodomicrobium]|uniref:hypothetical protein n=1 Tax=Rhodomicrobium TaxID=1068 RepID=UPI000F742334|nr:MULTISPECIES: hypothetical protein [Rhodomicrobium]
MRALITTAILAAFATPAIADDANLAAATTVLAQIQKDDAKLKAYCEMQALLIKADAAIEKKDQAQAKALNSEAAAKSDALGDDFDKVTSLDVDIDPSSDDGKKYFEAWEALEKSCVKSGA